MIYMKCTEMNISVARIGMMRTIKGNEYERKEKGLNKVEF